MSDITFLTALARSNVVEYNPNEIGIKGTIYIDYANKIGYIWSETANGYIAVFNSNISSGLRFMGLYDMATLLPNIIAMEKLVGDFWIISNVVEGSEHSIGDWIIWDGTTLGYIKNSVSISSTIIVENDITVSKFNCTYLVNTTSGNVKLTIPNSTDANKGTSLNIIKTNSDNNKVEVVLSKSGKSYAINKINESIGFVSSGNINYDWVICNNDRTNEPIKYAEFSCGSNDESESDSNWRIIPSGNELLFQRYLNQELHTVFRLSNQVNCNKFMLNNASGKIGFKDASGVNHTLLKPSRDVLGVCIGNPSGASNIVNNGSFTSIIFETDKQSYDVNNATTEIARNNIFQYTFVSNTIQNIIDTKIYLSNVSVGTRLRFVIQDTVGNILEENVSKFDFESDDINGGSIVTNGENIISLLEGLSLPSSYAFIVKMYFSSTVDLCGSTINLNDTLGLRFIPYLIVGRNLGNSYSVTHNGNIKTMIDGLLKDNRLDSSSLDNKLYQTNLNLSIDKSHINHTIIFTHSSGVRTLTISDDTLFNNGDKVVINTNGGIVEFESNIITPYKYVVLQKISSNNWQIISEYDERDNGQPRLYYGLNSDNLLTPKMVKDNISNYNNLYDWDFGELILSNNVQMTGAYYLYIAIPNMMIVDTMTVMGYCVMHGIRYILYRSEIAYQVSELAVDITINIS